MKRITIGVALGLAAVSSVSTVLAVEPGDAVERLKACARTTDAAARFACYEALGQAVLAEEPVVPAATVAVPAESTGTVASSGVVVAAASVPATSAPTNVPISGEPQPEEYRVAVSRCTVTKAGETYFELENGETWKRTGGQYVRESECHFSATLRRDFFGYKMAIDGGEGTVRVKRVK